MNRPSAVIEQSAVSAAPAGPFVAAPDAADRKHVLAERVELLYRQSALGIIATILVATVATAELWYDQYKQLVIFWWITALLIGAARFAVEVAYRRRKDDDPEKWLRWFAIGALAAGVNWGFAGSVFFPSRSDEQQVFVAFLLAGMASGGIPLLSSAWWIYALYAGGILIPFAYVLGTYGARLFTELAILVPVLYAANVAIAFRLDRVFASGLRLRHAYGRLAQDHEALNHQLEGQINELMDAHREVAASGRKLALFAERAPIAVLEMDANATILDVNPAAETLFGYASTELIGRSVLHMLFSRDKHGTIDEAWWGRFAAAAQPASAFQVPCIRRDGLELVCEFSFTPLVNDESKLLSVIAQGRDVTQQLEAERIKREFTSTLSHELRTPLTSIIGSLQLLQSGVFGDMDKDVVELITVAERNGERLLDLINDLLDIEKIESGKFTLVPEALSLDDLVRESLVLNQAFAERFGVKLDVPAELPRVQVYADRKRLLQVLTNLLSNAAKFSPRGLSVEVGLAVQGDTVRVDVQDRGPGIPEEFRGRIFSRFAQADSTVTRQKGGTGLGLAICKRLIELMDGKIGFADRAGGGTRFFFELPVHREAA
ncbi:MAG: PAS domain-containing sensor histidine kinase [Betaproteobacteria bacterium]|nr:PAS domain-containing sensor histidine kinase [Betaproteobacteria bacterium]